MSQLAGGAAPSPRSAAMMVAVGSCLVVHGAGACDARAPRSVACTLLCSRAPAPHPSQSCRVWLGLSCGKACVLVASKPAFAPTSPPNLHSYIQRCSCLRSLLEHWQTCVTLLRMPRQVPI